MYFFMEVQQQTDDEHAAFLASVHTSDAADVFRRAVARYTPATYSLHEAYCHSEASAHQAKSPGTPCYWCDEICDICRKMADAQIAKFVEQFIGAIEHDAISADRHDQGTSGPKQGTN